MDGLPDHGEHSYVGHGKLAGMRALITGGDSGIGQAAAINTPEQLGGALGIAILGAVQLSTYFVFLDNSWTIGPSSSAPQDTAQAEAFIAQALERGIRNVPPPNPRIARVYGDLIDAHAQSFRIAFSASAAIDMVGAIASWVLVRKVPGPVTRPTVIRRTRWVLVSGGSSLLDGCWTFNSPKPRCWAPSDG